MDIHELIKKYPFNPGMISAQQMPILLENLKTVIDDNIIGDVVELGCNSGSSSIMYAHLLKEMGSDKKLYLYDSFMGLPGKRQEDISESGKGKEFVPGWMTTSKSELESNFRKAVLPIPTIYTGWFGEIADEYYPEHIAFAFFDGDFYSSIMDSFKKVYHKVSKGGIICIHDYKWESLPGVEKACREFLKDKESIIYAEPFIGVIRKSYGHDN